LRVHLITPQNLTDQLLFLPLKSNLSSVKRELIKLKTLKLEKDLRSTDRRLLLHETNNPLPNIKGCLSTKPTNLKGLNQDDERRSHFFQARTDPMINLQLIHYESLLTIQIQLVQVR
jgi:hypothetical protein